MGDPLSVLGSIAGAATAGVQISMTLYEVAERIKNAPKEIKEIAGEMSLLSSVVANVGEVLGRGHHLYTQKFIVDVQTVISRITQTQKDVKRVAMSASGTNRLRWVFRSTRVRTLLAKIESSKTTLTLMLSTMQLAAQQINSNRPGISRASETSHYRQLAQNLVEVNRLALLKLQRIEAEHLIHKTTEGGETTGASLVSTATSNDQMGSTVKEKPRATNHDIDEPSRFTVPKVQSMVDLLVLGVDDRDSENDDNLDERNNQTALIQLERLREEGRQSNALWKAMEAPVVVDQLLSLWTELDDEEIRKSHEESAHLQDPWRDALLSRFPTSQADESAQSRTTKAEPSRDDVQISSDGTELLPSDSKSSSDTSQGVPQFSTVPPRGFDESDTVAQYEGWPYCSYIATANPSDNTTRYQPPTSNDAILRYRNVTQGMDNKSAAGTAERSHNRAPSDAAEISRKRAVEEWLPNIVISENEGI